MKASGGRVLFVGVGTSGCRIVSLLQSQGVEAGYLYASLDEEDLTGREGSIDMNGWDDQEIARKLDGQLVGRSVVFVVAGLGGTSGSNLAPRVSRAASRYAIKAFAVSLLPFKYQKWMEYRAGVALAKLKKYSDGVLVVDREQFVEDSFEELPLNRLYEMIDGKVADALEALFRRQDGDQPVVELRKLLKMMETGQATLEVRDLSQGFDDGLAALVRRAYSLDPTSVDELMIFSNGNRPITFEQAKFSSEGLKNLLGDEMRLHYSSRISEKTGSVIAMIASIKGGAKMRIYDPLNEILGARTLDEEPELGLSIDLGIGAID